MDFFFYPSSAAVFGSFKKGAIAYEILKNIIEIDHQTISKEILQA